MTTKRAGDVREGDVVLTRGTHLIVDTIFRGREWQNPDDVRLFAREGGSHVVLNFKAYDRIEIPE